MSQFSPSADKSTLSDYIPIKSVYPAGRLDYDSEGLLLLTDDGKLNQQIANPKHKAPKSYLVQIEGIIDGNAILALKKGVELKDGLTLPAKVNVITPPNWLWDRPIRERKHIPTCWIELKIKEGRNRQVRRMCAHVGYPCLRLVRASIGNWEVKDIKPGEYKVLDVDTPSPKHPSSNKPFTHKKGLLKKSKPSKFNKSKKY